MCIRFISICDRHAFLLRYFSLYYLAEQTGGWLMVSLFYNSSGEFNSSAGFVFQTAFSIAILSQKHKQTENGTGYQRFYIHPRSIRNNWFNGGPDYFYYEKRHGTA